MDDIFARLAAHDAENDKLNEELLAERDATVAKIEQLRAYRYDLDVAIRRRGLPAGAEESARVTPTTTGAPVVRRARRDDAAYVASVPVEHGGSTIVQVARQVMADGVRRSKSEMYGVVVQRKPGLSRSTFDSLVPSMGFSSGRDERAGAHPAAKVYWLTSTASV